MYRQRFVSKSPPRGDAEILLGLGQILHVLMRRGRTLEEAIDLVHGSHGGCGLAYEFFRANDGLKFRALAEEWSGPRIHEELARRRQFAATATT